MQSYILSCESTIDLPYSYTIEHQLPILFYTYCVDGEEFTDDMGKKDGSLQAFYQMLDAGKLPSTSQINVATYLIFFEEQLQSGKDLLHIAFGSGMTASVNNAIVAAEELKEKYPNQRIEVIDSYCSSSGYGFLVDEAVTLRDQGATFDEVLKRVLAIRKRIHHQFFSTDLTFYRRSGRMSGAAATIGNILDICPIMRLNDEGKIVAYDKVRGKKKAVKETVKTMEAHAEGGVNYSGKCWICHSNCIEEAEAMKKAVLEHFPNITGDVRICDIGTIIASHCGPGTVAVYFLGDEREPS